VSYHLETSIWALIVDKLISAVICTYNRADYLGKALQSLVDQSLDIDQYEIIVVDNCSTDDTRDVVCKEFAHVSNLHYIYESIQGLSQARNTGTENAHGKYIAFLDDDAIACKDWLERIAKAFENSEQPLGSVGGKIDPIWEVLRPVWLSDQILLALTVLDWFEKPTILEPQYWLAGANIAFPKALLKEMGGFQVELGRKGNNLLSNEETVMRNDIERAGYKCLYDPEIYVKHHVPAERVNKNWFKRRYFWQGISKAVLERQQKNLGRLTRLKKASRDILYLFFSPRQLVRLVLPTDHPDYFTRKCTTIRRLGYIVGLLGVYG